MLIKLTLPNGGGPVAIDAAAVIEVRDAQTRPELQATYGRTNVYRNALPALVVMEDVETVLARLAGKPAGQAAPGPARRP